MRSGENKSKVCKHLTNKISRVKFTIRNIFFQDLSKIVGKMLECERILLEKRDANKVT